MPELPEVETVCNALRPHLVGRQIDDVQVNCAKLRRPISLPAAALVDSKIIAVRRRAKFIVLELSDCRAILVHLGMTGACRVVPSAAAAVAHEHVGLSFTDGSSWRFVDVRRFGMVELVQLPAPGGLPTELDALGPEPLDTAFDAVSLRRRAAGRRCPIKQFLMDNAVVVGVGNIYASEALFRARIHPATASGRISRARAEGLVAAIKEVLTDAIAAGGTTIIDFRAPDGTEGKFARCLDVYGRAGEPCRRNDNGVIRRVVMGGRSTFYCPRCQR